MKLLCAFLLQLNLFTTGINSFIQEFRKDHPAVQVSVSIRSLATGQEVYAHLSEINLPPASTLKLLTTATAMEYLGTQYSIETMLYANGRVANGVLAGDLLVEGVGDPSFGSPRFNTNPFEQILAVLRENEIKTIEGQLRVLNNDTTRFPLGWLVGDIGNYYGAFSAPFNFGENLYTVYFNGGSRVGDPVGISSIQPFNSSWKIRNEVKTGKMGSGDQVNMLNLPFSNDILLVGTVPLESKNFPVKGAIPNVNAIFTDSLFTYLSQNGIAVKNRLFSDRLQQEELGSVASPSIGEISRETNFQSVNLFADGLANFMWEGQEESFDAFVKAFWMEKGVDLSQHRFLDGSGLSPLNTLSCASLTAMLHAMRNQRDFVQTLPVVGRDGTVASMAKSTGGRMVAKSGSISGVRNYAGYFTALSGKKYAFSVFVSGFSSKQGRAVREFHDALMTKMIALRE